MSTTTISNTYQVTGYVFQSGVTGLDVSATGTIVTAIGNGVYASASVSVDNAGVITSHAVDSRGVYLIQGGSVLNEQGGLISGAYNGIEISNLAGTIVNDGVVRGASFGALLNGTGTLVNGSVGVTQALIVAGNGAAADAGTIENYGTISGTYANGYGAENENGNIVNGSAFDTTALIEGGVGAGLVSANYGTISNFGTILGHGREGAGLPTGRVVNGSPTDRTALIEGSEGVELLGSGAVANYGTILGKTSFGVELDQGGDLINGRRTDPGALVEGVIGVYGKAGVTVVSYGTIAGEASSGVTIAGGGSVTNGAAIDTTALIEGYPGVVITAAAGTVANFGTILGQGASKEPDAVDLAAGGTVANGDGTDHAARIVGDTGVELGAAGNVTNFGTILGQDGYGVVLRSGGTVTNGAASDKWALIEGYTGVQLASGGSIANWGTIRSTGVGENFAVYAPSGGTVTNGALTDTTALIEGDFGLTLEGTGNVANFGTIRGVGGADQGVVLENGASLVNGSAQSRSALIEGYDGATGAGPATVTNFGTIVGLGGTAVDFQAATDRLVDEAGAVFDGTVIGGGGTLELAAGTGTLSGLHSSFFGFGRVAVDASGSWTLAGANTLTNGETLADSGTLTITGTLVSAGAVSGGVTLAGGLLTNAAGRTVSGGAGAVLGSAGPADAVSNLGTVTATAAGGVGIDFLGGGRIVNGNVAGTTALIASATGVVLTGPGTVINFGTISGSAGTALQFKSSQDLLTVEAHAAFLGKVLGGGGTLELAAGNGTLNALGTSFSGFGLVTVDAGAAWTLAGASTLAAGAKVAENGTITLGGTLTSSGDIVDAGSLVVSLPAGGALVDKVGAVLDFTANTGIATIGTGSAAAFTNAGLVEKTAGAGASTISVAITNTGTISVSAGTLDLAKAVSGAGTLKLAGSGILEADGAVAAGQHVQLSGGGETLLLTDPAGFAAAVTGFAAGDKLDLRSFAPVTGEKATFTANAGDIGGTLKVTDGANAFSVALFGQYVASGFHIAADGHGGSAVTYVPPPAPSPVHLASGGS